MKIKVLILGGTSFLGRNIVKKLLDNNYSVTVIIRECSKSNELLKKISENIIFKYGEIDKNQFDWIDTMETYDILLVLAWAGMDKENLDKQEIQSYWRQSLYQCTEKIIKQCNIQKVIIAGSQAEYGIYTGMCVDEEFESRPVTAYGKEKLYYYKQIKELAKRKNIYCIELRIHSIYGLGDKQDKFIYYVFRNMLEQLPIHLNSDCKQRWNFLHVSDCAEAFVVAICSNLQSGIYNIGTNETYTLKEYIEKLCVFLKISEVNIIYGLKKDIIAPDFYWNCEKFQKKTGWNPKISFPDGINKIIEN